MPYCSRMIGLACNSPAPLTGPSIKGKSMLVVIKLSRDMPKDKGLPSILLQILFYFIQHRSLFDISFHLSLCQSQPTTMSLTRVRTVVLDNMTININIIGSATGIISMDITAQLPATPFSVENVSCSSWCSVRRAVPPAVTVAAGSHQQPAGAHPCKRRHLSSENEAVSPSDDTPTPSSGTPPSENEAVSPSDDTPTPSSGTPPSDYEAESPSDDTPTPCSGMPPSEYEAESPSDDTPTPCSGTPPSDYEAESPSDDTPTPCSGMPPSEYEAESPSDDTPTPCSGTPPSDYEAESPSDDTPTPSSGTPPSENEAVSPSDDTPTPSSGTPPSEYEAESPSDDTPTPSSGTPPSEYETESPSDNTPTPSSGTPPSEYETESPSDNTPTPCSGTPPSEYEAESPSDNTPTPCSGTPPGQDVQSPAAGPSRDDHKASPEGVIGHSPGGPVLSSGDHHRLDGPSLQGRGYPGGPVLSTGDHHRLDGPSLQGRGYPRIPCEKEVDSVTGLTKSAQRELLFACLYCQYSSSGLIDGWKSFSATHVCRLCPFHLVRNNS